MSIASAEQDRPRRVRHLAREQMALMAFSAATSIGLSVALLLLTSAGR